MSKRWVLDEIVDPFGAKVLVERDTNGDVVSARFDLAGLPRVDALLTGQPTQKVPDLVEKLCGICPAAHHLAGVRALESLAQSAPITETSANVRRLLHLGSALETHAPRLLSRDRDAAVALRRLGKAAMAAAGSPGHFPTTAVQGGVRAVVTASARDDLAQMVPGVLEMTTRIARDELAQGATLPPFGGADVALVDRDGNPDLLGERLRAVADDGHTVLFGAAPDGWDRLVAEEFVGHAAPRPYLVALGPGMGRYRVGPVAQLRIGELTTSRAAELQQRWLDAQGSAAAARAVICVHVVEQLAALLDEPSLLAGDIEGPTGKYRSGAVGVGWVDGPRGLLVHRYQAGEGGQLASAQILTPTAQNEVWLAELLRQAASGSTDLVGMEDAVREADPCLPCSSAPVGGMGLQIDTVTPAGGDN